MRAEKRNKPFIRPPGKDVEQRSDAFTGVNSTSNAIECFHSKDCTNRKGVWGERLSVVRSTIPSPKEFDITTERRSMLVRCPATRDGHRMFPAMCTVELSCRAGLLFGGRVHRESKRLEAIVPPHVLQEGAFAVGRATTNHRGARFGFMQCIKPWLNNACKLFPPDCAAKIQRAVRLAQEHRRKICLMGAPGHREPADTPRRYCTGTAMRRHRSEIGAFCSARGDVRRS
jgi:hypothetical protein